MKANISIVIIHYHSPDDLKKSLSRLYPGIDSYEITVVDNSSLSNMSELKKRFPKVQWLQNRWNEGFAHAANQGIVATSGRWVLFLNPDVFISGSEIEELFHYAEKNQLDAVSPTFTDERYQKPLPTFEALLSEFTPLHVVKHQQLKQKTLVGGCVLVRRSALEKIGGWDERFFLWFEDSDLTMRLVASGYRTGFAPLSVEHKGAGSISRLKPYLQRELFFQSLDIFSRKYFSAWQQLILRQSVVRRFSDRHGYPILHQGASFVVPNIKAALLTDFLHANYTFLRQTQLIIVTSALNWKQIWRMRALYPDVRFIPIDNNRGFAATVNIGFRVATTEYVGTINDDVIGNERSIEELLKSMTKQIGSLNPLIYDLNEQLESAGVEVVKKGKAVPITTIPKNKTTVVPATNAACVLYNADALEKVGLFDEKFGSYLEDIDLSLRLRRAGYHNVVSSSSRVIHAKHSSSKNWGVYKYFLDAKNWWLVVMKNWTLTDLLMNSPVILLERLKNLSGILKNL